MKTEVLKHLDNSLPESAKGYLMSGYSIALEGWRRGLELSMKVIYEKLSGIRVPVYTLSDGEKSYTFSYTRANLLSKEIRDICKNKDKTKEMLAKAGVAVPTGIEFEKDTSIKGMIAYANELKYPVVLKPAVGTGGKGVITNILSDEELIEAVKYVKKGLKLKGNLIIERYFKGNDYRLYVVGDKVAAAYKRYPLHVTGNGKDSIKDLLEKKKEERKKNPSLVTRSIKLDTETETLLKRKGYTLSSIPKKGEVVALKSKNNVTAGGEAIDMTDELSDEIKEVAIRAMKAIPTMVQAGIDMMIDEEKNDGVVLEINNRPHITAHLYPAVGKSRDVPAAIIDYFFPETKNYNKEKRRNMYFDFDTVFEKTYLENSIQEMKVRKIPGDVELKRFQLTIPAEERMRFKKWLQMSAKKNNISGFVKDFPNYLTIVFGGREKSLEVLIENINRRLKRAKFETTLVERKRTTPVMQGFYLLDSEKNENGPDLEELPIGYKDKVERLVQAVAESNQQKNISRPSEEEYEILKSQIKNLQERLREYESEDTKKKDSGMTPKLTGDSLFPIEPTILGEIFKKSRMFSHMLPKIERVRDANHIITALQLHGKIVLKSSSDSEEMESIFIMAYKNDFVWMKENAVEVINPDQFTERLLAELNDKMIVQPFIVSETKDERPFIIRMSFFKDEENTWKLKSMQPLIGKKDSIEVQRLSETETQEFESFVEEQYGEEAASEIEAELKAFATLFPERFQDIYERKLDAFKVDIGIDLNKKLWIFELNLPLELTEQEKGMQYDIKHPTECLDTEKRKELSNETTANLQLRTKKLVVRGKVQGVGYRKWAKRQMEKLQLSGSAQNMNDGSVEISVTGNEQNIQEFKESCLVGPNRARVEEMIETPRKHFDKENQVIALLSANNKPSKFKYALACNAKIKGVQFYYFSPDNIDYDKKKIKGYCYENEQWVSGYFDYPDYIYDRVLKRGSERFKECYEELGHIPFSNEKHFSGPISKMRTYNLMKKDEVTNKYLIPYKNLQHKKDILGYLDKHGDIICKVSQGSLGKNVLFMSKTHEDNILVKEQSIEKIYTLTEFNEYIDEEILGGKSRYILQKYIESTTKSGNSFDIRTHLMKNRQGDWDIVKVYPRIGAVGSKISNLHFGGSTCEIMMFLNKHLGVKNHKSFYKKLVSEAKKFAQAFEKNFDYHFSEIALDVGLDNNENMYIFEVNVNQISNLMIEFEVAEAVINYGIHYLESN